MAKAHPLPESALLNRYRDVSGYDGVQPYTDCFVASIDHEISLADYVTAFYTTWLFKLERFVLRLLVAKPSTDEHAHQVAHAQRDAFAAWDVEARSDNQLLMCDFQKRTRSWFMVSPDNGNPAGSLLWFGSAVVPINNRKKNKAEMGTGFNLLVGFHKMYSMALLNAAKRRLIKSLN